MSRSGKSHSQILQERMQVTCGDLYSTLTRFWNDAAVGDRVPPFLILMHQIVRASVPLMAAARSKARARAAADPVCRLLADYLSGHIEEERNHDVWLLDDLEAIGIARQDVLDDVTPPAVASLVGAQYYWIHHQHPVALLGYIRVLEGNPPTAAHVDRLRQQSALPPDAFRTYRLHGELDPGHVQELDAFIDSLPLPAVLANLVWVSASHTASALARCLQNIERSALRSVPAASASGMR
jgi:hypothetical protein